MRFLLDVNVLVALVIPTQPAHAAAHHWFHKEADRLWATCPLTQAGYLRVAIWVLGGSRGAIQTALANLEQSCGSPNHEYWPIDTDLRDLGQAQRSRLIGHNQITDLQLVLLAHHQRGRFATFDRGARELVVGTKYEETVCLL